MCETPSPHDDEKRAREAGMADRHTTDERVLGTIKQLVDEEHVLRNQSDLDDQARGRLQSIRVELDQCWDLLRQRRALREFGEDPDKAQVRDRKSTRLNSSHLGISYAVF